MPEGIRRQAFVTQRGVVVEEGDVLPDGSVVSFLVGVQHAMNDAGTIAFAADLSSGVVALFDQHGSLVREGETPPDGNIVDLVFSDHDVRLGEKPMDAVTTGWKPCRIILLGVAALLSASFRQGPRTRERRGRLGHHRRQRQLWGSLSVTPWLWALVITLGLSVPAMAEPTPLTVNITSLVEIDSPEEGFGEGECWGDYEYHITIDGVEVVRPEFSIDPGFGVGCLVSHPVTFPPEVAFFSATVDVPDDVFGVIVTIEVIDIDTFGNDTMDISPDSTGRVLRLRVDPVTGDHVLVDSADEPIPSPGDSSPTISPGSYEGTGNDAAGISLEILAADADTDGDGLPDSMETAGSDWDGSGVVGDVPGEITDPMRADLFLELDVAASPTTAARQWRREDVQAMKAAFSRAPTDNPDGTRGITLWVDTGALVDPSAVEGLAPGTCNDGISNGLDALFDGGDNSCKFLETSAEDRVGNCGDGLENNGDGLTDGDDPTCLVGDNLGGGGAVGPALTICNLDPNFYLAKNADSDGDGVPEDLDGDGAPDNLFAVSRRQWFRYGLSVPGSDPDPTADSDGNGVLDDDPCPSGGQAEIGANDFVEHNGTGGTLMHEYGHTLGLRHGGTEDLNCKPNHVSVMNYFNQSGISRNGGGLILDFAPAAIDLGDPLSRNSTPATVLEEADLNETVAVDDTDPQNRFTFSNGNLVTVDLDGDGAADDFDGDGTGDRYGQVVQAALDDALLDWDGDGTPGGTTSTRVNVSNAGRILDGTGATINVSPKACRVSAADQTLDGADEWDIVQLKFRLSGDAANGAINPVNVDEPTREELQQLRTALELADLEVSLGASHDPAVAGTSMTLSGGVVNNGPNPADGVTVAFALPTPMTATSIPPECQVDGQIVRCFAGTFDAGTSAFFEVVVAIAADAAYPSPTITGTTLSASHRGDDPVPDNESATVSTLLVAEADLAVSGTSVVGGELGVVGGSVQFSIGTMASNGGLSSPMDATVTIAGSLPFATVIPAVQAVDLTALRIGNDERVEASVDVGCGDAGTGDVLVEVTIAPTRGPDSDPSSGNNSDAATAQFECLVPVVINVRPGQAHNEVNAGEGSVPVAVLTTRAGEYGLPLDFDVAWIDTATILFAPRTDALDGAGAPPRHSPAFKDQKERSDERTRDGDMDLALDFNPSLSGVDQSSVEACIVGSFRRPDGTGGRFLGCDRVVVLP